MISSQTSREMCSRRPRASSRARANVLRSEPGFIVESSRNSESVRPGDSARASANASSEAVVLMKLSQMSSVEPPSSETSCSTWAMRAMFSVRSR